MKLLRFILMIGMSLSLMQCSIFTRLTDTIGLTQAEDTNDDTLVWLAAWFLTQNSSSSSSSSSTCYTGSSTTTTTSSTGNYVIVDTNQSDCWTSSSGASTACGGTTGQDANYNSLTNTKQPSYTTSGDGTYVTDNNTSLVWTQSTDTNNDGTVDYSDKMYQADAVTYCSNLTTGGFTDWRLPDVKTLYSLILFSGKDASTYTGTDTSGLTPFIDTTYFDKAFGDQDQGDRIIDAQYATTTNYVYTTNSGDSTMFGVNFVDGRIKGYPCASEKYYVRCVRGNTDYGLNNFTDNGDSTITDNATNLMWYSSDTSSTNFDTAITACENDTTTGGQTDWRLPNIKELQSIMDYTRSPDTTSSGAINSAFTTTSFTNEEGETEWAYYWASTTHVDNDDDGHAGTYMSIGRALGYNDTAGQIFDVHGAGAQRSNWKINVSSTTGASSADVGNGTFYYKGPQGDVLRQNNRVLCVRN